MVVNPQVVQATKEITERIPNGIRPVGFEPITAGRLQDIVNRIVEELNPDKIIVFGSYAYGTPTVDSDLDILVIMETSAPRPERSLTIYRLLRPRPFPIDILVRNPAEIAQAKRDEDAFITEVLQRGKVIYERAG